MTPILHAYFFHKENVGTQSQVSVLLDDINNQYDSEPTTSSTNLDCWRSSHVYKNTEWLTDAIMNLVKENVEYYSDMDSVFAKGMTNDKKYILTYWSNVNKPGSRNVLHSHKDAIFSGVYYVKGSGTGDLRLVNPANILGDCDSMSPFTRDFYFTPADKDLIMWPSWMPHEVETNKHASKNRINIAFDIRIQK
ncbi:MAG: putative 2OG-Fe(II) oxygenase [Methylophagaceae bacterium]|jgi:uncharacterized protein (TIGR02466 family)|tara:strand:- start:2730 stop:3308 length:579 start_codon:yes stop_codon:yes gene_type:complete